MSGTCEKCNGTTHDEAGEIELTKERLGIRVKVVGNGVMRSVCSECGAERVTIPDLPGLIASTAVARVKMPWKLAADEIKFLRKALEFSARELADLLEVTGETVSRWENGKLPMGPANEKLLRLHVGMRLKASAPGIRFEQEDIYKLKIQSAYDPSTRPEIVMERRELPVEEQDAWLSKKLKKAA